MCFFGTNGTGRAKTSIYRWWWFGGGGNNSEKHQEGLEALGHGETLGGAGASFRGMDMREWRHEAPLVSNLSPTRCETKKLTAQGLYQGRAIEHRLNVSSET